IGVHRHPDSFTTRRSSDLITITDSLKKEGIARELVNRIQNIRKDSGFEVTDKVNVTLVSQSEIEDAVRANETYIKAETLTENISDRKSTRLNSSHVKISYA